MKTDKKRLCVGILAHVDAGKTTLSEALLYTCGVIRSLGRVDNQDAFLDTYAMEKERGITIFSKQAVLQTDELEISLLDRKSTRLNSSHPLSSRMPSSA